MPDIRSHRLVHRIPSYFDSTDPTYLAPPQGNSHASTPSTVALLVRRDTKATFRSLCKGSMPCNNCASLIAMKLIKKKDIFDPIEDDDDIDWKYNPFDVDSINEVIETPEQLMSQITFEGSPQLQTKLKTLVLEFIDVFATKVRREPMKIVIDEDK